jgi:transcriptional regulator with GAF, ATPase, and Fis domain
MQTHQAKKNHQLVPPAHWFWGLGPATQDIRDQIKIAARRNLSVLIVGETGTGKEVVAREIHEQRCPPKHNQQPFLPVNCGAVPESLAESMLFGHERGAFTSARDRQYGKFELAEQGTLFLDEIQNLSQSVQVKLLRVLQAREFERIGGKDTVPVDCQIICASNVPLELLIERGLFRKDLYYRLNACPIYIPALRQRREDLPLLISGLLSKLGAEDQSAPLDISPEAFEVLLNYSWPGNLRELEHALLFASLRAQHCIKLADLPPALNGRLSGYLGAGDWSISSLA